MKRQSENREVTYTKDPNKCISDDDPSIKDKHLFIYKNGMFECEELGLKCVAMGVMLTQIALPNKMVINSPPNCEHFTSAHWMPTKDIELLKEKGVFNQETWNV